VSEMVFRERKKRSKVVLNITSLIDVLFLLLIFFMITGTFKRAGEMKLQLPESSTAAPLSSGTQSHQVELVLKENGEILLNDEKVPSSEVPGRLRKLRQTDEESTVLLDAEAGARHGDVIRLLDFVREAGFSGVAFGTHIKTFKEPAQ